MYIACVHGPIEDVMSANRETVHSVATLLFFPLIFLARDGFGSR